jgi:hypothetical protein
MYSSLERNHLCVTTTSWLENSLHRAYAIETFPDQHVISFLCCRNEAAIHGMKTCVSHTHCVTTASAPRACLHLHTHKTRRWKHVLSLIPVDLGHVMDLVDAVASVVEGISEGENPVGGGLAELLITGLVSPGSQGLETLPFKEFDMRFRLSNISRKP